MQDSSSLTGSSPRWRGTLPLVVLRIAVPRFIPALAGNTWQRRMDEAWDAVHPRAGGEHDNGNIDDVWYGGSSPRWRGTPSHGVLELAKHRFIPALAGNTGPAGFVPSSTPVHPRAGGEHDGQPIAAVVDSGSSPRWRGTHAFVPERFHPVRFIPALAGNTRAVALGSRPRPVHPRAGGEHAACPLHPSFTRRFIPALAGNTDGGTHRPHASVVHPRAGGEHEAADVANSPISGSSPR